MIKDLHKKIKFLREEQGLSQEYVAEILGISRPTYIQIEKGERDLTIKEIESLANLFGITIVSFLSEDAESSISVVIEKPKNSKKDKSSLRINVPQSKLEVFKEVLLYVLSKVGAKPNIGETVLYKLLYFIDFDFYEKYEEQLVGATYIKNYYGPTPIEFQKIVEEMESNGELERVESKYFQYPQRKYIPLREPDLTKLKDAREIKHIDEVLARLSDKNANELSEYSHQDVPWLVAEDGKTLEYETVFYRTHETSVRNYEQED